jgi:ribonuclease BN (tRNA processing enzyme)
MRVELLPSSLPSSPASTRGGPQFLSSYLVNDAIAIDAGAIGLAADLDRQERIRHVFLTHPHLDHVAGLPLLVENVFEPGGTGVEVLASAGTFAVLRRSLFNDEIWPDFFALSERPDAAHRFVNATLLEPWRTVERAGCRVTPVPVPHGADTLAMVVDDGTACVAFAADTGPTDALWRHLAEEHSDSGLARHAGRLRAVFLECSFPDRFAELAAECDHHCSRTFRAECGKIPATARVIVTHRKARYAAEIAAELAGCEPRVELVEPGRVYEF